MSYENVGLEVEQRLEKARVLVEGGPAFAELFHKQGADLANKIRYAETIEGKSVVIEQTKQVIDEFADVSGVVLRKAHEKLGGYLITSAEEALTKGAEQFSAVSTEVLDSLQHGVSVEVTDLEKGTQSAFTQGLMQGIAA
ncbi:MAG TPA: hypothetical protein PLF31_03415 [Candidatus Paceibacterota bacterium]|nr:hypothetical protein [Candidatus Paceibacterota bacterium]